jgi:predicted amidohydrolase YtcJ
LPDAPTSKIERIILGDSAVAVAGGTILAAGARDDIITLAGPGTDVVDLAGAHLLPGLRDAHAHLVLTGLARRRIDLRGLSLAEVRDTVARRAKELPPGTWVEGAGFNLDDLGIDRQPGAADLDPVTPFHPVRLASHDLHAIWVNRQALEEAGRERDSPSYLTEDEVRRFYDATGRESEDERRLAIEQIQREMHSFGITEVQEHGRLDDLGTMVALANEGKLKLRVDFSVRSHEFPRFLESTEEVPHVPGLLHVNGQKLFLDGALGSRTAWMLAPYEGSEETGHRALDHEAALEAVRLAADHGLPTFMHAIGDAAVREALDLADAAPGLPHRVEHAQLVHPDDLPRFVRSGVVASVQTVHLLTDTPIMLAEWGEERASQAFPVRSLLAMGTDVCLGSDTPVETPDPMKGVFAASARRTLDGEALPGHEKITPKMALDLYVSYPRIEPDRPADLVAYPEDPTKLPLDDLPHLAPVATVLAGEVVYRA